MELKKSILTDGVFYERNIDNMEENIAKAKAGDHAAFEALISQTINNVKPLIISSYKPDPEDLKDAAQSASFKAWEKIKNFRGDSSFSTWFFVIFRNELLNIIAVRNRINKMEVPIDILMPDEHQRSDGYDIIHDQGLDGVLAETARTILEKKDQIKEYQEMILSVLDKLNPNHAQVIKMVFEDGKSYQEVSDELEIPIGTVMTRIYWARKRAQKLITQYAERKNIQLTCIK